MAEPEIVALVPARMRLVTRQLIRTLAHARLCARRALGLGRRPVLAAIFVDAAVGGAGLAEGRSIADQLAIQITGLVAVLLWSVWLSIAIAKAVQTFAGLRIGNDVEEQGIFAFTANAATTCNQEDFETSMVN